jgi:hypothetical protein
MLEPVKYAVGPWNFIERFRRSICSAASTGSPRAWCLGSPKQGHGEVEGFKFYEHMKSYLAAPPDVLSVDATSSGPFRDQHRRCASRSATFDPRAPLDLAHDNVVYHSQYLC